jgi:hypothetical protein
MLSAADGSPIWQWGTDKQVQHFARVGNALIVITRSPGETDWHLERVDLATGQVLQRSAQTFKDALYLRLLYLPEADLSFVTTPETNELIGLNPETLAVTWTAPFIEDCRIVVPAMPNGNLACRTQKGLAVYRPVTEQIAPATPAPPFERGDLLVTARPDVTMRKEPAADGAVAVIYPEAGTLLEFVGGTTTDAEGMIWHQVRDPRTARAGWIPADDLEVVGT